MSAALREILSLLSAEERAQLGNSATKSYRYPTPEEWVRMRAFMLSESMRSNPHLLDAAMTAYTPGETLHLLEQPEVAAWHEEVMDFEVEKAFDPIVFVPCAKTKPWGWSCPRGIYTEYNKIREARERKGLVSNPYFVTISEPLGIVPEEWWGDDDTKLFPQYDNPGLFKNAAQRSGIQSKQEPTWKTLERKTGVAGPLIVPFGEKAFAEAIKRLAVVIAAFIDRNRGHDFYAFVDDAEGPATTHGLMLDAAVEMLGGAPMLKVRAPKRTERGVAAIGKQIRKFVRNPRR